MNMMLFLTSSAQDILNGGYKSLEDFKNNTPNFTEPFIIEKRTRADIISWGGNDYKVKSSLKTTTKNIIKTQIWGIYQNDTLYLNGIPLTGLKEYVKVEILGEYCFLKPAFPIQPKIQAELELNDPQYGYMFGAIGGAIQGGQMAVKRIPLIYRMTDGRTGLLTKKNILNLLKNHDELRGEFLSEESQEEEEILLKYLKLLNAK